MLSGLFEETQMNIETPDAFMDFVRNSRFDYGGVKLWEFQTLRPYIADDNETLAELQARNKTCEVCGGVLDPKNPDACPDVLRDKNE